MNQLTAPRGPPGSIGCRELHGAQPSGILGSSVTSHDLALHQRRQLVLGDLIRCTRIDPGSVWFGPVAEQRPNDQGPHVLNHQGLLRGVCQQKAESHLDAA